MSNLDVALHAAGIGITPVPCRPDKKPMVKWREWQDAVPPEELIRRWFSDIRTNVAVVTKGCVVFDCDVLEKAKLVLDQCGDTPSKVRTPRGIHLRYRRRAGVVLANQVKIRGGLPIDIRTDRGLELVPESSTKDGAYRWFGEHQELRPVAELPVANIGWTRERVRRVVTPEVIEDDSRVVRRARGYIATVEGAVSGQRGHDRTFRVACVLIHKFGLTVSQALPLFREWNEQCLPPWREADLLRKLEEALRLKK